ncbi:MAG: hypothetical protein ACI8QS_002497 [Planctomycetota bacterium]|jgi:hypothetical protein
MATWIIGDVHGCAVELGQLLGALDLEPTDQAVVVGDLFHRGPDAWGVVQLMREHGVQFVLGNHELAMLQRVGLAPSLADGSDRPPLRTSFPPMTVEDLVGDGRRPLVAPAAQLGELLVFLQGHAGYVLKSDMIENAGQTPDGRAWLVVHAGIPPKRDPMTCGPKELVYSPRLRGLRSLLWYERYRGPELVLFGHTPNEEPLVRKVDGQIVALGLDTGCVYGGKLTAYCPERDEFVFVPAADAYATN